MHITGTHFGVARTGIVTLLCAGTVLVRKLRVYLQVRIRNLIFAANKKCICHLDG